MAASPHLLFPTNMESPLARQICSVQMATKGSMTSRITSNSMVSHIGGKNNKARMNSYGGKNRGHGRCGSGGNYGGRENQGAQGGGSAQLALASSSSAFAGRFWSNRLCILSNHDRRRRTQLLNHKGAMEDFGYDACWAVMQIQLLRSFSIIPLKSLG